MEESFVADIGGYGVVEIATQMIGDVPFVNDLRGDNDPSFALVPRITNMNELNVWCNARVDASQGWDIAPAGALAWRCVGFYLRTGAAVFIPKFTDQGGFSAEGVLVVHSWPGAPALPGNVSVVPDYTSGKGVAGFTNANGDVGFGYSGGMVYVDKQGVGVIWPLCPTHLPEPKFADCAKGLGWFGGTDHLTVNPVFQLVRKGSAPPPPPPPVEGGTFLRIVVDGKEVGIVPIVKRPIPSEDRAIEVYLDHIFIGDIKF